MRQFDEVAKREALQSMQQYFQHARQISSETEGVVGCVLRVCVCVCVVFNVAYVTQLPKSSAAVVAYANVSLSVSFYTFRLHRHREASSFVC